MSADRRLHPVKHLQFFLAEYSNHIGLPLMIGAVASILGLVALVALPVGAPKAVEGRITGLGFVETDEGSFATASVSIGRRAIRTRLPVRYGCQVGDRIRLQEWPLRFGQRIRVANVPSPCAR